MEETKVSLSLVDYLAAKAGCMYISDLKYLPPTEKYFLYRTVRELSPDCFPLREWNDALEYIAGAPNEADAPEARKKLGNYLLG